MLSYEPLFKTMEQKNITAYNLIEKLGFDRSTFYRIRKGMHISTTSVIRLACLLDCEIHEIIKYERVNNEKDS